MSRSRSLAVKALAAVLVVLVVLAGIWATGALLTNNFALAMWLTAAWMGLAGLLALAVAARSRVLRWPVLGAYALTAAVAGLYLGSSTFLDNEVNERVAVAAPPAVAASSTADAEADAPQASDAAPAEEPAAEPEPAPAARNVLVRGGEFLSVRHPAEGQAAVIRLAEGGRVLTFTGFEVDNGPDLRVYLVAGGATTEGEVEDYVDLGGLKGNKGDQQYEIPNEVDVGNYSTAVIWCRAFSVLFARAPLER
jgi:hypothetical protein